MLRPDDARRLRRTLIDIARRRQRPGSGSLPWRRGTTRLLRWPRLTEVLAGVPWAVAGAVATRRYMPERATTDLDIVVLPGSRREVASRLQSAGFRPTGSLAIGGTAWRSPDGVALDVIEGSEPWWLATHPADLSADLESLIELGRLETGGRPPA